MQHRPQSEILQALVETAEKWGEIFRMRQTSTGLTRIFRLLSEGLFNRFSQRFPQQEGFPLESGFLSRIIPFPAPECIIFVDKVVDVVASGEADGSAAVQEAC
jgi:hypothetical protein